MHVLVYALPSVYWVSNCLTNQALSKFEWQGYQNCHKHVKLLTFCLAKKFGKPSKICQNVAKKLSKTLASGKSFPLFCKGNKLNYCVSVPILDANIRSI